MPLSSLVLGCLLVLQAPALGQPASSPGVQPPPTLLEPIPDPATRETNPPRPVTPPPGESSRGGIWQDLQAQPPAMGRGGQSAAPAIHIPDQGGVRSSAVDPLRGPSAPAPAMGGRTTPPTPAVKPNASPREPVAPLAAPNRKEAPATRQDATASVPTEGVRHSPPEMVAALLKLSAGSKLPGRPMTLLDVLANAHDRTQRLAITHAYWRLSAALVEYNLCFREQGQLQHLQAHAQDVSLLRTAKASSEASLGAAEVALIAAQYELAEALNMPSQETLPLPADLPHIGPYRTNFEAMAARQPVPPRTRLIDRMLPVRRKAIDVWASAVQAAEDAAQAIADAYQQGTTDLATVLEYQALLGRRQRSFMTAVGDYNHDIADYALSIVGPEITGPTLVSMLIKTTRQTPPSSAPSGSPGEPKPLQGNPGTWIPIDTGVQPAGLNVPVPDETLNAGLPPIGQPPPAPPREQFAPTSQNAPTLAPRPAPMQRIPGQPTLAPPREQPSAKGEPVPPEASQPSVPLRAEPSDDKQPTLLLPKESDAPVEPTPSLVPVGPKASTVLLRTSYMVVAGDKVGEATTAGLYPGLIDIKPGVRTQRLAEALFWSRATSPVAGKACELLDCLRDARTNDRRALIGVYWQARQMMAEHQMLVMHHDWLEELAPFALEHRNQRGGPEEMLRLRAARLAVKASLLEAELRLLETQFELTQVAGLPLESAWLLPVTAPHAGPYRLKLSSQPAQLAASLPVKQLATTIPALSANLQARAVAVVEADSVRAAATTAYEAGGYPLDGVLAVINQQTTETRAFLATLTEYNREIAAYLLTVAPPNVPLERLVEAMVVKKQG